MSEPERDFAALEAKIAELPREVEPRRDLWRGIEARITQTPLRRTRWGELAVAAGVAAFVSGVMFYGLDRIGPKEPLDAQLAYRQLDATYQPLRQAALVRYRGQAETLDPALRETVEKNLAIIDGALHEIRMTLADRPNDPALRQMLQWTYVQELAVIDAVTQEPPPDASTTHYRGEI
jgi:hypothetical protein